MGRLVRILALTLTLILADLPAVSQAQAAPQPVFSQEDAFTFAMEYTRTVILGTMGGGLLLNVLVGGGWTTLAGAVAGSTLASWWFISQEAHNYIIRRAGPGSSRSD